MNVALHIDGCNSLPLAQDGQALYDVVQFPDIATPLHMGQGIQRISRKWFGRNAVTSGYAFRNAFRNDGHVMASVPQGWHVDQNDREPVIQILPKRAFFYLGEQVFVGGCNDPYVYRDGTIAAHAGNRVFL